MAESIKLPFKYEWYGSPDKRSYRVGFNKIEETIKFKPERTPKDGAEEVFNALKNGNLNAEDPRTITVKWYKHLFETHELMKNNEINGVLL